MKIGLASDHAGFQLKEALKEYLEEKGYECVDYGTDTMNQSDYPDFAMLLAHALSNGHITRGVVVCGSGIGVSIVANKIPKVRAALCLDEEMARFSRLHNDANVLALGQYWISFEKAKSILHVWLNTLFEGGRHQRRLDKIDAIEANVQLRQLHTKSSYEAKN